AAAAPSAPVRATTSDETTRLTITAVWRPSEVAPAPRCRAQIRPRTGADPNDRQPSASRWRIRLLCTESRYTELRYGAASSVHQRVRPDVQHAHGQTTVRLIAGRRRPRPAADELVRQPHLCHRPGVLPAIGRGGGAAG